MNNTSMIDLALNIFTLQKVPSRESPSLFKNERKDGVNPAFAIPALGLQFIPLFPLLALVSYI